MIRKSVRFFLNSLLPLFSQKAYLLYLLKSLKRTTTNEKTNYYFLRFSETCSNYVTNSEGLLSFSVPLKSESIPQNISKLLFRAIALDFPANETSKMQQPSNKLHVALTKSNLTSALAIQSARQPTVECGENSIATYYTAKPGEVSFETYVIKLL